MNTKKLKVFQYWDSGVEGMPQMIADIYKHNLRLSQRYNFELILITQTTAADYFEFMMAGGVRAFYRLASNYQSDIVRFFVLHQNGGIWLDSDAIILKDLNLSFKKFQATNAQMVLDEEYDKKIGCASIMAKPNTVCSNYCMQYLLKKRWKILLSFEPNKLKKPFKWLAILPLMVKILGKLHLAKLSPRLKWVEIGPDNVEQLYLKHSDKIKLNTAEFTKYGCNFISWIDSPGYQSEKWLFNSADEAAKKANNVFNHSDYVLTWTIYNKNNLPNPIVNTVFANELSVFHHFLKLANKAM